MAFALQRIPGARLRSQQQAVFSNRRGSHKSRVPPAAARAYAGEGERQSPGLRELQASLAFAVRTEDWAAAVKLRDAIHALSPASRHATEIEHVKQELQEVTAKEEYQEAARLRDRLLELLAPPQFELPPSVCSDTVANGVRVTAESSYDPDRSHPEGRQFVFGCTIRITNEGPAAVQLRSGYWRIIDGRMNSLEVRGHEVVGEQPILRPGQSWEYRLACPLCTPVGSLEGYYEMWTLKEAGDRALPTSMFPLKAVLGKFGLKAELETHGQQQ